MHDEALVHEMMCAQLYANARLGNLYMIMNLDEHIDALGIVASSL